VYSNKHLWVVILAAGEGQRVKDLTRDRWGLPAPKQYALINGQTTLLDTTIERAKKLTPAERITAVVARQHRRWWESELADLPPNNVIAQPENRGTAAGILLPLLWITGRDPDARLVFLPSDHHVASEEILHESIVDAVSCTPSSNSEMVLLGVQPERPETDYGWIVPKPWGDRRLRRVARFREKPHPATAAVLFEQGALLNTFILIAGGRFLLDLFETALPQLWHSFRPVFDTTRDSSRLSQNLHHIYTSIPSLDFSKDLLEQAAGSLWVHTVPACGWLDLGSQERLADHLIAQGRQPSDGHSELISSLRLPPRNPPAHDRTLGTTETTFVVASHAAG